MKFKIGDKVKIIKFNKDISGFKSKQFYKSNWGSS